MPAYIGRYPYGKKLPVQSFLFEELNADPQHQDYLWSNSTVLLVFNIAESFTKNGWQFNPNENIRIAGFPGYYHENEQIMKPCAEINLTSKAAEIMCSKGFVPMFSVRNGDVIQIGKLASITEDSLLEKL